MPAELVMLLQAAARYGRLRASVLAAVMPASPLPMTTQSYSSRAPWRKSRGIWERLSVCHWLCQCPVCGSLRPARFIPDRRDNCGHEAAKLLSRSTGHCQHLFPRTGHRNAGQGRNHVARLLAARIGVDCHSCLLREGDRDNDRIDVGVKR